MTAKIRGKDFKIIDRLLHETINMTCRPTLSGCFSLLPPIIIVLLIFFSPLTVFGESGSDAPDKRDVEARYDQGKFYFNQLHTNASLAANRDNWLKCIHIFQNIYLENPSHSLAPASLYMICRIRLRMFDRFHDASDLDTAIAQLQNLVKLFPRSSLADDALFALGKLYLDNKNDRQQAVEYFNRVINEYPDSDMYTLAAQTMQQLSKQYGVALPNSMMGSAPDKLNTISPVKYWSSPRYGRIVVGASGPVAYKAGLLPKKSKGSRLYIDFTDSYTTPADRGKVTAVTNGLLRAITTEQKTGDSVRIVVEAENIGHYEIYSLPDPFRVVVDIRGQQKKEASLSKSVPKPPPASIGKAVTKTNPVAPVVKTPASSPTPGKSKLAAGGKSTEKPVAGATQPPAEAPKMTPQALPTVTKTAPTMSRLPSLAQQLGLGVKKIVIDPGHGGKDPGAMAGGLKEKDVVLAVAKRLKPALEKELGCQVVLTRDDDHFLGLEERTAFANTQGADLFLSLHLNANSSAKVHGFETYYLNLTTNPEAMRVAALENATSAHQLSDLQDILSSIMKNSKIAESSRLARLVNDAVEHGLSNSEGGKMKNHGVKQAPFYVLIGAQMPAILLEMAFISNPDDAKRITSDDYVAEMAEHIAQGIRFYINSNTAGLKR